MINVILCGGKGTRLWPVSRSLMPKQFIKIFNGKSLFQETILRNKSIVENSIIVSNGEQHFLAAKQLEEIDATNSRFLIEPIGRNTAPAIALACMMLDKDDIVLVSPSDHRIKNIEQYNNCLRQAEEFAMSGFLVTFGIKPSYPETGFGYIEVNNFDVKQFHEKPERTVAEKYIREGSFYWNSGMFCFKAGTFLSELNKHSKKIYDSCLETFASSDKSDVTEIKYDHMIKIPENSIDYAVMEKSDKVKVIPAEIDWSDVGSFDSLYGELDKDEKGNTKTNNLITINAHNNLVVKKDRAVVAIDVDELIIVDTADALLVSKRGSSQKVKEVVSSLNSIDSELPKIHVTAHRPWGTYTILEESENYKVKRIVVSAGKRLSLQKHFHRSEHWTVVYGIALVTVGEKELNLQKNQSVYINKNEIHRLENIGTTDLILIETQVGDYLGEDDIVRISDDFKRI